jgi:hypothetical protein
MWYPFATKLISTEIKLARKKVPYEPKPLLNWFVRLTMYADHDEERTSSK